MHTIQASCVAACRKPLTQKHAATPALPGAEVAFPGHATHPVAADGAPATTPYVPASHSAHPLSAPSPAAAEYFPAAHARHAPLVFAPTAALHVPAGHSAHAALPRSVLNAPAAHSSHGAPSAPYAPAVHVQLKRDPEAAGEKELVGQR